MTSADRVRRARSTQTPDDAVALSSFQQTMELEGFRVVYATLEPIRRDGPPEAMMVVARLRL